MNDNLLIFDYCSGLVSIFTVASSLKSTVIIRKQIYWAVKQPEIAQDKKCWEQANIRPVSTHKLNQQAVEKLCLPENIQRPLIFVGNLQPAESCKTCEGMSYSKFTISIWTLTLNNLIVCHFHDIKGKLVPQGMFIAVSRRWWQTNITSAQIAAVSGTPARVPCGKP